MTVKLKPVFKYLRQLKLKEKKEYSVNIETLNKPLKTRTNTAMQSNKNIRSNINDFITLKPAKDS